MWQRVHWVFGTANVNFPELLQYISSQVHALIATENKRVSRDVFDF